MMIAVTWSWTMMTKRQVRTNRKSYKCDAVPNAWPERLPMSHTCDAYLGAGGNRCRRRSRFWRWLRRTAMTISTNG